MARTPRRGGAAPAAVAVLAASLAIALLAPSASVAHTYSRQDGNDSPGRLDIRTASVKHGSTAVIHTIRTYEGWTVPSLSDDSFFIVAIDTNRDRDFEKCAIILKVRALRGALTNCGRQFIRSLDVAKPSGTTVNVKIPEGQLGGAYRWAVFSYWTGPPAGCADTCFDAAPNAPPPILHDLTPPVITMPSMVPIRTWEGADGTDQVFTFPFSLSDAHTGISAWRIERRFVGEAGWTNVASGMGGGLQEPEISGLPGERADYRVVARDLHGNVRKGTPRRVYVALDQAEEGFAGSYPSSTPVIVDDNDAYGTSYAVLDQDEVFSYNYSSPACVFELIGPRTGVWSVHVTGYQVDEVITSDGTGGQRELLFSSTRCSNVFQFVVTSGSGFGIDAVVA